MRVGTGEFCSREHRNQYSLRRSMDQLQEANVMASLLRRREQFKTLASNPTAGNHEDRRLEAAPRLSGITPATMPKPVLGAWRRPGSAIVDDWRKLPEASGFRTYPGGSPAPGALLRVSTSHRFIPSPTVLRPCAIALPVTTRKAPQLRLLTAAGSAGDRQPRRAEVRFTPQDPPVAYPSRGAETE